MASSPSRVTAVGIPARVVRVAGRKVEELDHRSVPDPVAQELARLRKRLEALESACHTDRPSPRD